MSHIETLSLTCSLGSWGISPALLVSILSTAIAIYIPTNIARTQNKINLLDKRIFAYNNIIKAFSHVQMTIDFMETHVVVQNNSALFNVETSLLQQSGMTMEKLLDLEQVIFLFKSQKNNKQIKEFIDAYKLYATSVFVLLAYSKITSANNEQLKEFKSLQETMLEKYQQLSTKTILVNMKDEISIV